VVVLLAYTFLVLRINSLSKAGPSEDAITEKLQSVKLPKIDKAIIDKIQQLQDNSVDVQTLFKNARDNPFQE
jgi:dephospho-CoA kinase